MGNLKVIPSDWVVKSCLSTGLQDFINRLNPDHEIDDADGLQLEIGPDDAGADLFRVEAVRSDTIPSEYAFRQIDGRKLLLLPRVTPRAISAALENVMKFSNTLDEDERSLFLRHVFEWEYENFNGVPTPNPISESG
ncbi:MAG: hypothetical protein GC208_03875 [Alphaproteobacteria bacterium]|nr:hypothetical protein [Alphaproteobacteria bacterium]